MTEKEIKAMNRRDLQNALVEAQRSFKRAMRDLRRADQSAYDQMVGCGHDIERIRAELASKRGEGLWG